MLFGAFIPMRFVRKILIAATLLATCGTAWAEPLRVYAIRGFAGAVFSRGMNKLCDDLTKLPQVSCSVEDFYDVFDLEKQAFATVASGQRLVLVGHSLGANAALRIATGIKGDVPLVVTIDPNWFLPPSVPANVEIVLNYYQTSGVIGHATLQPPPGFRGKLEQFLRSEPHHRIDASPEIHAEIVTRVRTILANPASQSKPPIDAPGSRQPRGPD